MSSSLAFDDRSASHVVKHTCVCAVTCDNGASPQSLRSNADFETHPLHPLRAFSADDERQRYGCRMRPGTGCPLRLYPRRTA